MPQSGTLDNAAASCPHAAAAADACDGQDSQQQQQVLQRVVAVRHGRRLDSVNPSSKLKSKRPWDPPLAPGWTQECASKAPQLQGINFGLVLVSPFTRCAQTAAGLMPHLTLDPDCRIFFHRGLSELFFLQHLFFPRPASAVQQIAFWWWKRQRNRLLPEFATMGGVAVEKKVLGSWPALPETASQARARLEAAMQEAVGMAEGSRNILLVSHAAAVEYSVYRMRNIMPDSVAFLGHVVTCHRRPQPGKDVSPVQGSGACKEEGGGGGGWWLEEPEPGSGVVLVNGKHKLPRR